MNLLDEIRDKFAETKENKSLKIDNLPPLFPGWVLRIDGMLGVAIPFNQDSIISEHFSGARLWSGTYNIDNRPQNILILATSQEIYRENFAVLCAEFLEPGNVGKKRKELINKPVNWWSTWKEIFGNKAVDIQPYPIIAELFYLIKLMESNTVYPIKWGGRDKSTHDLMGPTAAWEIKSTRLRYDSVITISSKNQLHKTDEIDLRLIFFRFEADLSGISLNKLVAKLEILNYDMIDLEKHLANLGFEKGSSYRECCYVIHEIREYEVDDSFPKITDKSFIEGKLPDAIIKLTYDVDLNNLPYKISAFNTEL